MEEIFDPSDSEEFEMTPSCADLLADWPTAILRPSDNLRDRLTQRIGAPAGTPVERQFWKWDEVSPGISCIQLTLEEQKGIVTMLVRLAPGADYPPHRHSDVEELFLLDGELCIDDRILQPGDYSRATAGTTDRRVWSETGCTCLLITSVNDVIL